MQFTRRNKIVIAIGSFLVLVMGYRFVSPQFTKLPEKAPLHVKELEKNTVHQQQQAKSLSVQHQAVLTAGQKKELNYILQQPLIYHGVTSIKQVALTFDDGPDHLITPRILDILKKHQVNATFFVQGNQSKINPLVVKRMDDEGHTVGNHSYNHPQFTKLSNANIEQQLFRTDIEIEKAIGKKPTLFRLPYGASNPRVIKKVKEKGYSLIQWSVDTNDWRGRSATNIWATVQKRVKPGAIILQHSNGTQVQGTVDALPRIIEQLKKQGYQFVTMDQMLDVPPYRS